MSFQRDYLQDGSGDEVVKMNPDKVSFSLMFGGRMVSHHWHHWWPHPWCKEHSLSKFTIGLGGHGSRFWLLGTSLGLSSPLSYPWCKEHRFQLHICCAGTIWSGGFWWRSYEHQQQTKNSLLFRWSFVKYTMTKEFCRFFSFSPGKAFRREGIVDECKSN